MAFTPALGGGSTSSRKEKRKKTAKITKVLTQSVRDVAETPFERRGYDKGRSHNKDVAITRGVNSSQTRS